MNFENYQGKRVRIYTNIIDEETNKYKTIEGIFDGWESLGSTQYIIVDGETYPEMCITRFGLIPEVKIVNKVEVESEFIPAMTLQVDPLDTINNAVDEVEFEEENNKPMVKLFSGKWFTNVCTASFIMLVIFICSMTVPQYNNYMKEDTKYNFNPIPITKSSDCKLTTNGMCCNNKLAYVSSNMINMSTSCGDNISSIEEV